MNGLRSFCWILLLTVGTVGVARETRASDWPQFMRNSEHTGDAADEKLKLPLGLVAQIKLDDAILTSPAVVSGRVYVVDQMGTAYCIDPNAGKIVWQTSPDGKAAMGSNTSSPCVAKGKVCYGTTAGNLHILNAADGKLVKTVRFGWSILGSVTCANDSVYFQTLDAVLHCLDLNGKERWRWDHYANSRSGKRKRLDGHGARASHYSGNEVAVSGKQVVSSSGWDIYCLQDKNAKAERDWTKKLLAGLTNIPMATVISGDHVYASWPGSDGAGNLARMLLKDGSLHKKRDRVFGSAWAVLGTPAVRGDVAYFGRQILGVSAYQFGAEDKVARRKSFLWHSFSARDPKSLTPVVSSLALSAEHCLFTTLKGELIAVNLSSRGKGPAKLFRFKTPHGKPIASSPAISGGQVYFGCDDGYLYVLGSNGSLKPRKETLTLHQPRSRIAPATGKSYAWPSPFGNPGNTGFIDDAKLKPPLKLRWAVRSFGHFKQPLSATTQDIVYVTLGGLVVCMEQATGRIRWRHRLPEQAWGRSGVLCAEGRVYVPRTVHRKFWKLRGQANVLTCFDGATGKISWQADIGTGGFLRSAPVLVKGVIAFGSVKKRKPPEIFVEAWNAKTGKLAWKVKMNCGWGMTGGPAGCVLDGVMIFSGGGFDSRGKDKKKGFGETVAIDPATGKVLWRTDQTFVREDGAPSARDGRIYLSGAFNLPVGCISAKDGSLIWQHDVWKNAKRKRHRKVLCHAASLGPDFFTITEYRSGILSERWGLSDGKRELLNGKRISLGGRGHACGSIVLTSGGIAIAATVNGLYLSDVKTGKVLWHSRGFASRACSNPIVTNGRIFYNPQVNNMLFCFEPGESSAGGVAK